MFCDLADSTALSASLDPEDMRDVIVQYQKTAARTIAGYDGYIAQYMGDGILVYFGYPRAHEDDAERAVRAALRIVADVAALEPRPGLRLRMRVGIATGVVVVGDMEEERAKGGNTIVGDAPNLAARLQALGRYNTVVIAPSTRRLLGTQFEYEDLGEHILKGFAQPVRAWAVTGASSVASRFEAARSETLSPLVGRASERELMADRWQRAVAGDGQVVAFGGEAGIGKSRLARSLVDEVTGGSDAWAVELQCSPFHTHSALYPVVEWLRRSVYGEQAPADDAERLAALEAFLRRTSLDVDAALPLFANLLAIAPPAGAAPSGLSPDRQRLLTHRLLVSLAVDRARHAPGAILFEDLHWADPSTLDLADRFVEGAANAKVLVLFTHRPEFVPRWTKHGNVTAVTLQRLGSADAADLVRAMLRQHALDTDVMNRLVEKTDGIPLYIEELAKTVVESRQAAADSALEQLLIPASLHDSLLARLDLLGEAKGVAQIASVLGREFDRAVLEAVWGHDAATLAAGLERLVAAEFIFARDDGARYVFKHALIQDAAYESLLKSSRVLHHQRIAEVLERSFPEIVKREPERVAQHFGAGRRPEKATQYWATAGRQSLQRNAHVEAAAHLHNAIGALGEAQEAEDRALQELDLLLALGPAQIAAKGYASPDVEATWTRAQSLCATIGDVPQQFPALFGLWMFHCVRANHANALGLSSDVSRRADAAGIEDLRLEAHLAAGISHFFLADFAAAASNFEACIAMYDRERHAAHRFQFGQDPAVVALNYSCWMQWIGGDGAKALETSARAVDLARSLDHPFTLSFALSYAAWLRLFLGDLAAAREVVRELHALTTEHDIPVFLAWARVLDALLRCHDGERDAGVQALQAGLDFFRATGSRCFLPYWTALHAEQVAIAGDHKRAQEILDLALAGMEETGERWAEPELIRLQGVLLDRRGASQDAEHSYRAALDAARARGMPAWGERAAASLAAQRQTT